MKLWLDDTRPAPEGWKWVKNIGDAISWIVAVVMDGYQDSEVQGPFEECSLDHDLGLGDDLDGIRLVDWMAWNNIWPQKKPVVHSMNPVGRKRMEMTIDRYFSRPCSRCGNPLDSDEDHINVTMPTCGVVDLCGACWHSLLDWTGPMTARK